MNGGISDGYTLHFTRLRVAPLAVRPGGGYGITRFPLLNGTFLPIR